LLDVVLRVGVRREFEEFREKTTGRSEDQEDDGSRAAAEGRGER
jgi:hypothetical protein